MGKLVYLITLTALLTSCTARRNIDAGTPHDDPYRELALKLSAKGTGGARVKAAVLPFSVINGQDPAEGTLVAERLLTRLAGTSGFEMIERTLIEKVLEELKFQASGAAAQPSERNIGRVLGVEAVISGTISRRRDGKTEINARVIDVESGAIMSAASETVQTDLASPQVRAYVPQYRTFPAPPQNTPINLVPAQNEFSLAGPDRIFYFPGEGVKNFEASIELMFKERFSAAGLIFRASGPGAFYQYEWYTEGDNACATELGLMHGLENGWKRLLPPIKSAPKLNRWYEFKVRAKDGDIECYLDGKRVFKVSDSRYRGPGKIGLRIWLEKPVYFRKYRLSAI